MCIHEILRYIRTSLHWPVSYLAEKAGVDHMTIFRLEKNGGGKLETYEKLLNAMGYEFDVVRKESK